MTALPEASTFCSMALACPRFTSGIFLTWTLSQCWDKRCMRVPPFYSLVSRREKDGARWVMETEWIEATEVRTKVPVEVLQAQRAGKGHFSLQCREAEEKLQNQPFLWNWALGNNCTCFASMSPSLRLCNQAPLQLSEQQLVWAISHDLILTQSIFFICVSFFFFLMNCDKQHKDLSEVWGEELFSPVALTEGEWGCTTASTIHL